MLTRQISHKQQEYIETIYYLCILHGHAHIKDIAEKLGNKMASVSEAVKKLSKLGLVNYSARKAVTLTNEGLDLALELRKKHTVLADFYYTILGLSKNKSDKIACSVEHFVDLDHINRISSLTELLKKNQDKLV